MTESDCCMNDTLNNFTFQDVGSQLTNRGSSIISDDISFDDSSFLKNLSFDFETIEKANFGEQTSASSLLKYQTEELEKAKEINRYSSNLILSEFNQSNKNNQPNVSVKYNVFNSEKENVPTDISSENKEKNSDVCKEGKKIQYKQERKNLLCEQRALGSSLAVLVPSSIDISFSKSSGSETINSTCNTAILSKNIYTLNQNYELSAWGLPDVVLEKYSAKKIKNMFSWQFECLSNSKVLNECSNLIYSAPTSAGKTLVAEILALKTIFERKKRVIFILPFVSIVREKMYYFQDILGSSGIRAEGFMGSYNPPGNISSIHFAICTIEKANSLINRLLEEGRLSEIGAILVDEMHLLGDPHRGYILELLLTKLKYISLKDKTVQIQIIGMSATLPNLDQLAKWLEAELYSTSFRPIPLYEQVSVCGDIYDKNLQLVKKLEPLPDVGVDTDHILQLCLDTIKDSCSVLIFCPTKNWCENLAQQLSLAFFKIGNTQTPLGDLLRSQIKSDLILEVLEQLKFCPVSLDIILKKTVSFGIAFHHAGLTMDERDIIEGGFRSGAIKILVATSTLSSGVNLPARRVLIRSTNFCGKPLDLLTYRQMVGRAGRMGKDTKGESILICQKSDWKIAKELMCGDLPAVESCLEGAGKLKRAILEVIASGVASSPNDVALFTNCTLLAVTNNVNKKSLQDPICEAVEFLKTNEFIRVQKVGEDIEKYVATSLGKACLASSIAPDEGLALFTELEKARQCFVLQTELHLIYLVTPYSACYSWGNIDWMFYLELWDKLPSAMKRVGELVGVRESYIVGATRGKIDSNSSSTAYHKMLIHKRFFVALALQDLVNEVPLGSVCVKFSCNRGMLQSLQQSAATFAGMATSFSRQLGWASVEILLEQFQDRMQFGVSRDLLDLMRLPSLNGKLARTLYSAGIETIIQLANHELDQVENILCRAGPFESCKGREGESEFENKQRKKLRTVWITGKEGLTERKAAELLVTDARNYLKIEMGLKEAKWKSQPSSEAGTNESSQSMNSSSDKVLLNDTESKLKISHNSSKVANTIHQSIEINVSLTETQIFSNENNNTDIAEPVDKLDCQLVSKKLSPKTLNNHFFDPNKSNSSSEFSDLSFTRLENNLLLNDKMPKQEKTTETKKKKVYEVSNADVLKSNSPFELNISETSLFSSFENRSLNKLISDTSITDESLSLQLSDESSNNKNINSFTQSIDEFQTQGIFETALQNIDMSQETNQNTTTNASKFNNSRNNVMQKRIRTTSDDSFLEATPTKKSKMLDELKTPFSSTIKKYSQLSLEDNISVETTDFSKLHIVEVCNTDALVDTFFDELNCKINFSFSVVCTKILENKNMIGANILNSKKCLKVCGLKQMSYKDKKVEGFAFCWGGTESYFLSTKNSVGCEKILKMLRRIFTDEHRSVKMYDAKEQIKILKRCCDIEFYCKIEDPKVADWLLDPEGKEKSLQTMTNYYCKELHSIGQLCGKINAINSFGLNVNSTAEPKLRASSEVVVTWHLMDALRKKLSSQMTIDTVHITGFPTIYDLEMRTLLCLANMELCGMSANKISLQHLVDLLEKQQNSIEKNAYSLAGRKFNFASSTDVSKVIGTFKGKKISTRRQVLEQNEHPISALTLLWRKVNFTLTKMVYPLIRSCDNNRIYGTFVSHTATGRITMHEPNIQMVTKDFNIIDPISKKDVLISCRSAFSVPEKYTLVSADYCQLELRILTYLSKDKLLTEIMGKPGDIFTSVAAKWNSVTEKKVDENMRQNTKQLCYGIIYGMGAKTLSEQMNILEEDAIHFMESFRNKYSGIKEFIRKTVALCKDNGYVETIAGRRRYLPHIKHADSSIKSQAERQAVNTTVQGSAADIVKHAMITIENKMNIVFQKSRFKPKIILNLHDELIYEVPEKYIEKTVKIIRSGMENSASVFGRFPVKVKTGKSWGQLSEYHDNNL